ncbi:hypothetical protein GGF46_004824 [Coemansia sp. RSA 552]|nr:hypothetical protein GGF46_004824 [Coemansia sp. RSA 552]
MAEGSSSRPHLYPRGIERVQQCTSEVFQSTTTNPPPMRLKQPTLCDPDVRQNSGYLDLEDKHVFFWHFGSRARQSPNFNASSDSVPLVFWFSGGPGCSSQIANWQENGPCNYEPTVPYNPLLSDAKRKELPHGIQKNPYAWNAIADIVFIDQPVGTGFSYGPMPNSTEAAADVAWRAMQGVYSLLDAQARKGGEAPIQNVYLFGESYGGRYIPVFTEYLLHMNDEVASQEQLRLRGYRELPLSGIGIGNGMFDMKLQAPSYYNMGCESSYPAIFNKPQCAFLKGTVYPQCLRLLDNCYGQETLSSSEGMRMNRCIDLEPESYRSHSQCGYADTYCNGALNWTTGISTYDVRPGARMVPDEYVEYLRKPEFKQAVGASNDIDFVECSDPVFDRFVSTADGMSRSAVSSLEYILDKKVPVLLYSGDADFICNWYGTVEVAKALNWHGKSNFANVSTADWSWPAQSGQNIVAGQFMAADNLAFLRVYEAGHEVPYYQPQASLYMLAQFLDRHTLY